jgi:3-mercaptopyruvate sulfurtransferase SseA
VTLQAGLGHQPRTRDETQAALLEADEALAPDHEVVQHLMSSSSPAAMISCDTLCPRTMVVGSWTEWGSLVGDPIAQGDEPAAVQRRRAHA